MRKCKIGLIAVASPIESGGERAQAIIPEIQDKLKNANIEVILSDKVVWDETDAIEVSSEMNKKNIDTLVLVHLSWVQDSIQYILYNTLKAPVVLWALPYPETFSVACVQHFASILSARSHCFSIVSGLPEEDSAIKAVIDFSIAAMATNELKNANIGMIGPRQTWRISGPQDMTYDEWDLTEKFGTRIIHIEMNNLISATEKIKTADALKVLDEKMHKYIHFSVEANKASLIYSAKIYLAVKQIFADYRLCAAAIQCYPMYGGISNLASSWLADEANVLDTEGDIGHALLMILLNIIAPAVPSALGEIGKIDIDADLIHLVHEGSSAQSLALSPDMACITPAGENGTAVGFVPKQIPYATVSSICGMQNRYKLLLTSASVLPVGNEEWLSAGRKFHAYLKFSSPASEIFNKMIAFGLDHHLVIKEGNYLSVLQNFSKMNRLENLVITA